MAGRPVLPGGKKQKELTDEQKQEIKEATESLSERAWMLDVVAEVTSSSKRLGSVAKKPNIYLRGETSKIFQNSPENWGRWTHFD